MHRGVAYWADGNDQRILFGTGDGYLICLNAQTGKPISTFGQQGRIDLTQGLGRTVDRRLYGVSSPPIICRDVVVMGAKIHDFPLAKEMPPGDVRGFDVRTGKQQWLFRAVPGEGEFGNETWDQNSWKTTGGANVWTLMSADEALGYANLIDIRVNGKPVKAIAQVSKQGFCYVFDRVTGRPIWPIEERPVPQSTLPGERLSPTQPFPTRPAPFDRQGITENDVIDFTPELRKEALAVLEKYNFGPVFTPPSLQKPTILMPGIAGGASWAGAACDPETGILYVPSITLPWAVTMAKSPVPHADYTGAPAPVETMQGVPLWKPPYGRITAIDLNTAITGGWCRWVTWTIRG